MACSSTGTCQSGCYSDEPSVAEVEQRKNEELSRGDGLCVKCKVKETIAATRQDVVTGGDIGRFCFDCFRFNLFGKFRLAVTSNAMISPSDKVLVAFSGGCSSRVALQFVHEMQQKAKQNFDATAIRDRSLPVFGVGVVFINECSIYPVPSDEFNRAINEMELIVSSLAPPVKDFAVVPTESIYSLDGCSSGKDKLKLTELVGTVSDVTGKEDLSEYLRMLSLQEFALRNGYTKIVLGTCTSRIACHVLEATIKGQGFSLAGDIQYVDARWKIPVVLPLRDCLSEELNLFCRLESLKIIEAFQWPRSGINGLIAAFVKLLQEENPSRESTIMRTAGKLIPFSFNKIPEGTDVNNRLASKRRQKKYNLKPPNESLPPESLCVICCSPFKKPETSRVNGFGGAAIYEMSCSSCQYQILPKDPSSLENFVSVLPQWNSHDKHKLLRDQIEDFLLTDSDDGN